MNEFRESRGPLSSFFLKRERSYSHFKELPEVVLGARIEILSVESSPSAPPRLTAQTAPSVEAVWDVAQGFKVAAQPAQPAKPKVNVEETVKATSPR
jgi:hypothetical protein